MSALLDTLTEPAPPFGVADWNDDGVVILPSFIDELLIDGYVREWKSHHGYRGNHEGLIDADTPRGWPDATPYMRHRALRALCCDERLARTLDNLLGEPAGVHLNLTGWLSTERDWHQDSYLNPPHVGDFYAAVWFALDDIDPDSGPFQYVPGSHRWPQVTRERIAHHVDIDHPEWPKHSEQILTPLFTNEIEQREADVVTYVPKRGDVLIWHGRLLHRGSKPNAPGMERRALIAHYSGGHHRGDMPRALRHERGGYYFPIGL